MVDIIGVAGDWHGNKGWARLRIENFADLGVTKILHLGDFGIWPGNPGAKYLHRVNKLLGQHGMTIYVTLGNHEDYVQVSRLQPARDGSGWLFNPAYPNIMVAPRGHRWEWEGTSFVSLGGANSIDRFYMHRVENVSWWSGEQISLEDVFNTVKGGHADVMLAHDCPYGVPLFGGHKAGTGDWSYEDIAYSEKSRMMLKQAVDTVKPDLFFHGHYHFFADHTTVLNDGLDDYTLHSIGLDQDTHVNNIGLLSLPDLDFTVVDYSLYQRPAVVPGESADD